MKPVICDLIGSTYHDCLLSLCQLGTNSKHSFDVITFQAIGISFVCFVKQNCLYCI